MLVLMHIITSITISVAIILYFVLFINKSLLLIANILDVFI